MKRFFSIIGAVVIVCFSFFFSACKETEIAREQILLEFSQYEADPNVLIVHDDKRFYFADHDLDSSDLGLYCNVGGAAFKQNEIYLGAWRKDDAGELSLLVFKTDFYGNSPELVFQKSGYGSCNVINITGFEKVIYFAVQKRISFNRYKTTVERYDINTGEMVETISGTDLLSYEHIQYQTKIKPNGNVIDIEDPKTGEKYRIDETTLQKSETYSSMQKFKYEPYRCEISNGHILVAYSIGSKESWGYSGICVIYEYNSERDSLEYKAVILPCDAETSDFVYAE